MFAGRAVMETRRRSGVFDATDFAWEKALENAQRAFQAGGAGAAAAQWQQGLAIARAHFAPEDPRLAASYTNAGFLARRQGCLYDAETHFQAAFEVWDRSWRWLRLMTPAGDPDGSYDAGAQARFTDLVRLGRRTTEMIEREDALPVSSLQHWLAVRPNRPCDLRKLLGAVLLIAARAS